MSKRGAHNNSAVIRDVILGGQDGLVNVLGIVLAVATATHSRYVILIAGLAAAFAESISMAAVVYTSTKAGKEFYHKKRRMIAEEFEHPVRDAVVVGVAAIIGSFIPLLPFIFGIMNYAITITLIISTVTLFITGLVKAKYTGVHPLKSGLELAVIGMAAAIAGYLIGIALGALPII